MDIQGKEIQDSPLAVSEIPVKVKDGATKLSALDLNNIRLDVKHTLLTPDYLEKLSENQSSPEDTNPVS